MVSRTCPSESLRGGGENAGQRAELSYVHVAVVFDLLALRWEVWRMQAGRENEGMGEEGEDKREGKVGGI